MELLVGFGTIQAPQASGVPASNSLRMTLVLHFVIEARDGVPKYAFQGPEDDLPGVTFPPPP